MKNLKIALFINLMLSATLAGLHFGGWVYYNRGLDATTPYVFVSAQQAIEHAFNPSIAFFFVLTALSGLPALYYAKRLRSRLFPYILVGFLCMTAAVITTVSVNVHINNEVLKWAAQNPPADWQSIRHRWDVFNEIRTILMMIGMTSLFLGLLCEMGNKPAKASRAAR